MANSLVDRLASMAKLSEIPREELRWIVGHGDFGIYESGIVVAPKDKRVDKLIIILSGKVAIRVDRGVGLKLVEEWHTGDVTGMLPYSRMTGPPGDNYIEEKAELITLDVKLFPQMITQCPSFTAYTVHCMIDRVRKFNTSDLQDEKMISLGKLAGGLAHELNNPASATVRNAKLLLAGLNGIDEASKSFTTAGLTKAQLTMIINTRTECLVKSKAPMLSPIQKSDHQDYISDWLERHSLNPDLAEPLTDILISIEQLDKLENNIPAETLPFTLNWIATSCTTQSLAKEIEITATQIYKVVDAVKKFTYMGNPAEMESLDLEPGIRNTISILIAKTKAKNASISLEIEKDIPLVSANGSDLNQVWFSLLDNALDAISKSGNIRIKAHSDLDRVVVNIIDDGPGIPRDIISKIFDPFYTTKSPGQGTGLGLDIARRLLRRYHGDISVQSQPGKTDFCVSLLIDKPEMNDPGHATQKKHKQPVSNS